MFQGDASHLPLKLNSAGVIPPIFASSLLLLPITVANFSAGRGPEWLNTVTAMLGRGQPLHIILYIALIVFFAFFYTAVVFNPKDTADNLKKYGGFLPGIRPGERLQEILFAREEPTAPIGIEGIVAAKPVSPSLEAMRGWLAALEQGLAREDRSVIFGVLHDAVPDFGGEAA